MNHAEVGVGFGVLTTRPEVASKEPEHAVGLLGDSGYVSSKKNCLEVNTHVLSCFFSNQDVSLQLVGLIDGDLYLETLSTLHF